MRTSGHYLPEHSNIDVYTLLVVLDLLVLLAFFLSSVFVFFLLWVSIAFFMYVIRWTASSDPSSMPSISSLRLILAPPNIAPVAEAPIGLYIIFGSNIGRS